MTWLYSTHSHIGTCLVIRELIKESPPGDSFLNGGIMNKLRMNTANTRALVLTPDRMRIVKPISSERVTFGLHIDIHEYANAPRLIEEKLSDEKGLVDLHTQCQLGRVGWSGIFLLHTHTNDLEDINHRSTFASQDIEMDRLQRRLWRSPDSIEATDKRILRMYNNFLVSNELPRVEKII